MFFASAAFLAGLALLTIPWWLHRLNAHASEQRTFSSLFLMRASEAPVNLRKRLQHLVLLALRWLLLIAACLAFAEPVLKLTGDDTAPIEAVEHRIIVIDTSLSMARNDGAQIRAARAEARDLIGDLPTGAKAAIVTAADALTLLVPLTDDTSRLTGALAGIEPASTRLAMAGLMSRVSTLTDTLLAPGERARVYVISDFQATGLPDQFNALVAGLVWPTELVPVVAADEATGNRAIVRLHPGPNNTLDVTVQSFAAPGAKVTLTLTQNDDPIGEQSVFVPENGSATATFALPESDTDARRREAVVWTATLEADDALAADNVRRLAKTDAVTAALPVLTTSDRAYAYLRAAVAAAAPRFTPQRTSTLDTDTAPVVAVLGADALAGGVDRQLIRYLEAGGAVLVAVDASARSSGRLPLVNLPLAPDRLSQSPRGVVAADASHPVLAGFGTWQGLTVFQALGPTKTPGRPTTQTTSATCCSPSTTAPRSSPSIASAPADCSCSAPRWIPPGPPWWCGLPSSRSWPTRSAIWPRTCCPPRRAPASPSPFPPRTCSSSMKQARGCSGSPRPWTGPPSPSPSPASISSAPRRAAAFSP
ncbi:MAG: BatA domain-containing protein [Pseudomonadales bacterium]